MNRPGACSYCNEKPSTGALNVDRWIGLGKNVEFLFCSEDCRAKIAAAASSVKKGTPWFLAGVGIILLLVLAFIFLSVAEDRSLVKYVPAGAVILAGALILGFPLVASNAVRALGIRSAARLARIAGSVMMLAGVCMYLLFSLLLPHR